MSKQSKKLKAEAAAEAVKTGIVKCADGSMVSLSDLQAGVCALACDDARFNKKVDGTSGTSFGCGVWCCDVEQGDDEWSAIVQSADRKMYRVGFEVEDGKVTELDTDCEVVVRKTQYVSASYHDLFYNGVKVVRAGGPGSGPKPGGAAQSVYNHKREDAENATADAKIKTKAANGSTDDGEAHHQAALAHYDAAGAHAEASNAAKVNGDAESAKIHDKAALSHVRSGDQHSVKSNTALAHSTARASSKEKANNIIRAADGHIEGKPTMHNRVNKMHAAVQEAVKDDPRFRTKAAPAAVQYDYNKPYVADVLVPDDDGKHHAVIRRDDSKLVKHGFDYDVENDSATMDKGDSTETECTPVYTAELLAHDELVKAAAKKEAPEPEAKDEACEASTDANKASAKAFKAGTPEAHKEAAEAHGAASFKHKMEGEEAAASGDKKEADIHEKMVAEHDTAANAHKAIAMGKVKAGDKAIQVSIVTASGNSDGATAGHGTRKTAAAKDASKEAATASAKATASGTAEDHKAAVKAHEDASDAHLEAVRQQARAGASQDVIKEHTDAITLHDQAAEEHQTKSEGDDRTAAKIRGGVHDPENSDGKGVTTTDKDGKDLVHCRAATELKADTNWSLDKQAKIMWMPGGISTVSAGYNDRTIRLTVDCDEDTAKTAKASYQAWRSELPKQKPFLCIEHREQESAGNPETFEWDEEKEPGVYCSLMPSGLGVKNVNERIHRSFSPSFTTDAEYHKCICADCEKKVGVCKCNGPLTFPKGVRGSEGNPAKVTGIGFSVGSLTNKPAFKTIAPVKARQGGTQPPQKEPTEQEKLDTIFASLAKQASPPAINNGANEKGQPMQIKIIKAHGDYKQEQVGKEVEVDAATAATLIANGYGVDAVEAARTEKLTNMVKASQASRIKDAVTRAKAREAIAPKDTEIEAGLLKELDDVPLETLERVANLVVASVDARQAAELERIQRRETNSLNDDGNGVNIRAGARITGGYSLRGAAEKYVTCSEPMTKLIQEGKLKDAINLSRERSLLMASDIMSVYDKGENFAMRDLVKAADNVDPSVGTLATGLVLMRNLGFLKNKLTFLDKISTDLRNEPVAFGQNVLTRYITPPNVLTFVPGIGMTSDATTIANWKATITASNPAGTPQTSGTQTFSVASATDVNVVLNNYNGVEITFNNMTLGSTMRNLFAEQQAAQFYSLAEYINQQFLIMLFKATWSGISTAPFSLCGGNAPVGNSATNPMGLANIIAVKNKFTMNKMPDNGRFALMHSAYHDAILTDSNMLTAKSILALIKKDTGAFEDGELPTLFGVKVLESQLSAFKGGALVTITDPAQIPANASTIGFAGNASSALFVARIPQDYTKVIPDIPATAAIEIVTEPDSGLSMLVIKRVNNQIESTYVRAGLMFGFAQGDPRQGFLLNP